MYVVSGLGTWERQSEANGILKSSSEGMSSEELQVRCMWNGSLRSERYFEIIIRGKELPRRYDAVGRTKKHV